MLSKTIVGVKFVFFKFRIKIEFMKYFKNDTK